MRRVVCLAAGVAALMAAASSAFAQSASVEHGKYLVEHVARCPECHTPRKESGELDRSQWMKGATLMSLPIQSPSDFHRKSPDLSSTSPLWTRWGQEGVSRFLQTAKNPRGNHADPPMPTYTLDPDDAQAIVAYLKSLP